MTPKVEADADAEVLFWEVRIADDYVPRAGFKTVLNHYLRIKVFNERGRGRFSKAEIPFGKISGFYYEVEIRDIVARTIKPDGTVMYVKPGEVFDQDTVTAKGIKLRAKTFAFPGIEPGAIVEYKWKEVRINALSNYIRLELSRDIPVRYVKYYVRPVTAPYFTYGMRVHSLNTSSNFVKEDDGFYSTTMTDVPSFRREPRMPPDDELKPWVLIYYADDRDRKLSWQDYWVTIGKKTWELHSGDFKSFDNITKAAARIAGQETDQESKLRQIFDHVKSNIKNVDDDSSGITSEQRKEIKPNRTVADTLSRRTGTWHDINMLFAALARAAGMDARVANVAVRTDASFDRQLTNDYFIRTEVIAVKVGDDWRFFDPGSKYVPFGMVYWSEEGQDALISDPDQPIWSKVPVSTVNDSRQKRSADLKLLPDGSLEGTVRIEYTGHIAARLKESNDDLSQKEREDILIKSVRDQTLSGAEATDISIENVQSYDKPFTYSYRLRVPAYAERTGKRIFLAPNIFEHITSSLFVSGSRRYMVAFEYPWTEDDEVRIEAPAGWSFDQPDPPQKVSDPRGSGFYDSKASLSDDHRSITYKRTLSYGRSGPLVTGVDTYPRIKQLFEAFHNADGFVTTISPEAVR